MTSIWPPASSFQCIGCLGAAGTQPAGVLLVVCRQSIAALQGRDASGPLQQRPCTPCCIPHVCCFGRLFCGGRILPGHSAAVAAAVKVQADFQGVALYENCKVAEVQAGRLRTGDSTWHSFDEALWCTQAAAAGWLYDTGLPVGTLDGVSGAPSRLPGTC